MKKNYSFGKLADAITASILGYCSAGKTGEMHIFYLAYDGVGKLYWEDRIFSSAKSYNQWQNHAPAYIILHSHDYAGMTEDDISADFNPTDYLNIFGIFEAKDGTITLQ